MHDIVANVETSIPFQALDRRDGTPMEGARISIRRRATNKWWDGDAQDWVDSIVYNDMDYIVRGAHEYLMTFPAAGEYRLLFTDEDEVMISDSYMVTVYPEDRVTDTDLLGSVRGSGAEEGTVTILDEDDVPVADADVWVTIDLQGNTVVAGTLQTNSLGKATFWLDNGQTYYIWGQKDGTNFDNPSQVVW